MKGNEHWTAYFGHVSRPSERRVANLSLDGLKLLLATQLDVLDAIVNNIKPRMP